MQMSNEEIVRSYRDAKNKAKQLGILAELNACDTQKIKDILIGSGMDYRRLPRGEREKKAEVQTAEVKPVKENKPVKEKKAAVKEKPVNTQCDNVEPVKKEEPENPKIYVPEIVKQAVTEKMIQVQESMDKNVADLSELSAFLKQYS